MHIYLMLITDTQCMYHISRYSDEYKGQKPQTNDNTTEKTSEQNTQAGEHGLVNDSERHEEELSNTKNGVHTFSF